MKHIVIDLEMNPVHLKSEIRNICTTETIEIGAVMLDDDLHEIDSFRTYVKPEYNDSIVPKISRLTGITNDMVADAPTYKEAFRMFTDWCMEKNDEVTIYAWSDTDYNQIIKEITLKNYELTEAEHQIVDSKWTDFQREFDSHLGFERQVSLALALEMAGIDFAGKEHDALDDARNTSELLRIFKDEELFNKTLRKIEEAMKPTSLGNTLGSMFDFSGLHFS